MPLLLSTIFYKKKKNLSSIIDKFFYFPTQNVAKISSFFNNHGFRCNEPKTKSAFYAIVELDNGFLFICF